MKCSTTVILFFFIVTANHLFADNEMIKADSLFELRSETFDETQLIADSINVNKAMMIYQEVINQSSLPEIKHEAVWKILRCYYFKGNYTTKEKDYKKDLFMDGIQFGESYLGEYPGSVELHNWIGILWGYSGEVHSQMAAAKLGVPKHVRYYAKKTIELDDTYMDAGGYRMLGRLHFMVPKIPLILTWPSKEKSLEFLEKAYKIAPHNLLNMLYLAETLIERKQVERGQALLREIINTTEIKHGLELDTWIMKEALKLMEKTQ